MKERVNTFEAFLKLAENDDQQQKAPCIQD